MISKAIQQNDDYISSRPLMSLETCDQVWVKEFLSKAENKTDIIDDRLELETKTKKQNESDELCKLLKKISIPSFSGEKGVYSMENST